MVAIAWVVWLGALCLSVGDSFSFVFGCLVRFVFVLLLLFLVIWLFVALFCVGGLLW